MPSFLDSFPEVGTDVWTKGFVVTSFLIGGSLGSAASGWLNERLGRRATLRLGAALFVVGGATQAVAHTLPMLFGARGVSGVGIGLTAAVVPVYAAELSPADRRGMMISFNQYNITGGIMVSFWANLWLRGVVAEPSAVAGVVWTGWRIAMLLQCVPAAVLLFGSIWLPESPRWLVQQGRSDEARRVLGLLRGEEAAGGVGGAGFMRGVEGVIFAGVAEAEEELREVRREESGLHIIQDSFFFAHC